MNSANDYRNAKAKQAEPDLVEQAETLTLDDVLANLQYAVNQWDIIHLNDTVEEAIAKLDELVNGEKAKTTEQIILDLLLRARSAGLKYPKVQISINPPIVLSMNARGQINITNGERYGTPDNKWFAKIDNVRGHATLIAGQKYGGIISAKMRHFANHPAERAAILGKKSGVCMFCRKQLSHPASLTVGYGPTCAENYGLPWGDETTVAKSVSQLNFGDM